MKKTLLSFAIMGVAGTALATETSNGRLTAMSGAGFATANYVDGVLLNPSLGAAYKENDDVGVAVNGGAKAADEDELRDGMEELVDYLDYLSEIRDYRDLSEDMADELIALMEAVDGDIAVLRADTNLVVAVPNKVLSAALVAKVGFEVSFEALIDENDYELIENSIERPFDPEELNSSATGRGALVTEVGLALSKAVYTSEQDHLLLGVTPKAVTVETVIYTPSIYDFDEEDLDAEDYSVSSSAFNFDMGATYMAGNMRYAFVVQDVMSKDFETISGDEFTIKAQSTASVGYVNNWFVAEAALDLNAVPSFALAGDTRHFRAGVEFNAWRWVQLRAGIKMDLENTEADTYSVGVGFSPFDTVNVDLAGVVGDKDTAGAALQVGLRF